MSTRQVWLITGAGRGLGRALTHAALEAGHTVVATVRGEHALSPHERLHVRHLDVRDRSGARAVVAAVVSEFGRVDVLVNNAGYGLIGAIEEVGEGEVRDLLDADLLGPLWLSQAVLPVMRRQGSGHIVQISTVGAVGTMPTLGLYNAAKWGLEGWTEAMAAEVAGFGVRTTIVESGAIDTEWATGSMRFATPAPVYDDLRTRLFGTSDVPWPPGGTGGGTSPDAIAGAILAHVADASDRRLRLLVGEDAPAQVRAALEKRIEDYRLDPGWSSAASVDAPS
jgi:NAD(P)-dependent dehydrogenase (short-subunit alcohol dehydrogenase family)